MPATCMVEKAQQQGLTCLDSVSSVLLKFMFGPVMDFKTITGVARFQALEVV